MPPRSQPLPEATTESARAARKSFFCGLCQKGYARMPEYEAHENSYDHQHRKRLKEMRQMTRDPNAAAKARLAEERANEEAGLRALPTSAKAGLSAERGGGDGVMKKRPVFKSTLQPHNAVAVTGKPMGAPPQPTAKEAAGGETSTSLGRASSDTLNSVSYSRAGNGTEDDLEIPEDKLWAFEPENGRPDDEMEKGRREWERQWRVSSAPVPLRDVKFANGEWVVV